MRDVLKDVKDIMDEVERTTRLHGGFNSAHECYAVLLEEVDEFWDIVKLKREKRDVEKLRSELIQIAAMAIKGLGCVDRFVGTGEQGRTK